MLLQVVCRVVEDWRGACLFMHFCCMCIVREFYIQVVRAFFFVNFSNCVVARLVYTV